MSLVLPLVVMIVAVDLESVVTTVAVAAAAFVPTFGKLATKHWVSVITMVVQR